MCGLRSRFWTVSLIDLAEFAIVSALCLNPEQHGGGFRDRPTADILNNKKMQRGGQMTTRTWTGSINNDASNPGNWSPNGAPQPGDTLTDILSLSTIDIRGDALAGDSLAINIAGEDTATLNLSQHADLSLVSSGQGSVVVNVTGNDTLNAVVPEAGTMGPPSLTVDLAGHARMTGSFYVNTAARLTISGAKDATYIHNASDTLTGASAIVDTELVGSGAFILSEGFDRAGFAPSKLEFGGFVSAGQTIDITGGLTENIPQVSQLTVDAPQQFHATTDLHDFSLVDLEELAQADSWSYKNDLLSIQGARGRVLDQFHVISDAASTGGVHGLTVSKTAAGDVLVSPGTDFSGSIALTTS